MEIIEMASKQKQTSNKSLELSFNFYKEKLVSNYSFNDFESNLAKLAKCFLKSGDQVTKTTISEKLNDRNFNFSEKFKKITSEFLKSSSSYALINYIKLQREKSDSSRLKFLAGNELAISNDKKAMFDLRSVKR